MKKIILVLSVIVLLAVGAFFTISPDVDCAMSEDAFTEYSARMVGSIMADIDYADDKTVVFHYLNGMFVYDITSSAITQKIDLSLLDCAQHSQGSNGINVVVSSDGKQVLLVNYGPENEIKDFENYIINLENATAKTTKKENLENPFTAYEDTFAVYPQAKGFYSNRCIKNGEKIAYLTCETTELNSLKLCVAEGNKTEEKYIFDKEYMSVDTLIFKAVHDSLKDGAEILVNSGLEWNINVPKSRLSEVEELTKAEFPDFSFDSMKERMIFDVEELTDRNLRILMYDVDFGGSTEYHNYVFDNDSGELILNDVVLSYEQIAKIRSVVIKIDKMMN